MKTSVIIVAAGSARRAGFDKLLAPLAGVPVVVHSLRAFAAVEDVAQFIVVTAPERQAALLAALGPDDSLTARLHFVPGGAERHLSVQAGLDAVDAGAGLIAVHDGARPLIHPDQIRRCLARAAATGAAACARPVSETLKRATPDGQVSGSVEREGLWIMETPQIFHRTVLTAAYEQVIREGRLVTDEVSAVEATGHAVWLVDNPTPNLKITWPGDLLLAERLLA